MNLPDVLRVKGYLVWEFQIQIQQCSLLYKSLVVVVLSDPDLIYISL